MKRVDFNIWLDARRKFAKMMMEKARDAGDTKDESYYLGRMNEAKMVKKGLRDSFHKVSEKKPE